MTEKYKVELTGIIEINADSEVVVEANSVYEAVTKIYKVLEEGKLDWITFDVGLDSYDQGYMPSTMELGKLQNSIKWTKVDASPYQPNEYDTIDFTGDDLESIGGKTEERPETNLESLGRELGEGLGLELVTE